MDLKRIRKAAKDQGWREDRTKDNHPRFWPPDRTNKPCTFSSTPGDVRAIRNFLTCMKASGLKWPPPGKGQR